MLAQGGATLLSLAIRTGQGLPGGRSVVPP